MWDYNAPEIFQKITKLLEIWSKRKLTLQGRITIIKSLAISKFVHLFLALPNPHGDLIQNLNKLFYKFLWNTGPDKIKRKNIIKSMSNGGLKMVRIDSFIVALKITWLRRYILQEHCTWSILSNFNIGLIYSMGDSYMISKIGEIKNPFWKDLLKNWMHFSKIIKIEKLEDILYSPIWYNSKLLQGQNFFIKE